MFHLTHKKTVNTDEILIILKKKIVIGAGIIVMIVMFFKFCEFKKEDNSTLDYNTNLIQQQIVNVGKLIVTEGHFAEVVTCKSQDKYLLDMISFDQKARFLRYE